MEPGPDKKNKGITVHTGTPSGMLWFAGWLFTISFAQLIWWKAILGLLIWPYYLGSVIR